MATATKTRKPAKPVSVSLLEIASGHGRVDAEAGIIYDAKIVGLESRNVGRTIGLNRTEFGEAVNKPYGYAASALETAIPMYEGSSLRVNHPATKIENGQRVIVERSRGVLETVGELQNVRLKNDGLYGDMHLIKSNPAVPPILETAEKMPHKIALSHNANGRPALRSGRAVIEEIYQVNSVDIVGDKPGTTNGLFETALEFIREHSSETVTLREVFESLPAEFPGRASLVEMAGDYGDMEMHSMEGSSSEQQVTEALYTACEACLRDEGMDSKAKLGKIKALLKVQDEVKGTVSTEKEPTAETKEDGKQKTETMETHADPQIARLLETQATLETQVNELRSERDQLKATNEARALLESMHRDVTAIRIEAVVAQPNEAKRKELIETWLPVEPVDSPPPRPKRSAPLLETEAAKREVGGKGLFAAIGR